MRLSGVIPSKNFEDRTALPEHIQRRDRWLAQQPTSRAGLSFPERLAQRFGVSDADMYLLRAKLFGRSPVPDFNRPLPGDMSDGYGPMDILLGKRR